MDEEDVELAAIRAKLQREFMADAARPPTAEPVLVDVGDADLASFVETHDAVVVDCWAPWCGPCRIVGPIVEELSRDMAGRVAFAKLNVDHNPRASQAFGIQSIPTLLVFKQGQLVDRIVGALPKAQLAAMIDRQLGGRRTARGPGPRRL